MRRVINPDRQGESERDIVHVCLLCCMRESTFNVYYAQVARRLIDEHKRFKVSLFIFPIGQSGVQNDIFTIFQWGTKTN